jgi:hypothetical protein
MTLALLGTAAAILATSLASAGPAVPASDEPVAESSTAGVLVDRAVVRFVTRETGGPDAPRFVFERQLAFEARLEALSEGDVREGDAPFRTRHVRAALERHIAETVLESLATDAAPKEPDVEPRVEQARLALLERVGGLVPLGAAMKAEGIGQSELVRLLRRQALASLYLDRSVAPMLAPTDAELRNVLRGQRTPFSGRPFDEVEPALRRWVVGTRLGAALATFYDGLRTRMTVTALR